MQPGQAHQDPRVMAILIGDEVGQDRRSSALRGRRAF
jgi:hypothetical protein